MQIHWLPLEQLTPYDNNPRDNSEAVDKVAMSLDAFGFKQPIVVDQSHVIIVGHTRFLAAKQLKLKTVPVLVAEDLTPEKAKAYRLADNRTHEESRWNQDKLAAEIRQLLETELDLGLTGFDARELAALSSIANRLTQPERGLQDCPDPPLNPVSQIGDLWLLGHHRLLCGDSTDLTQVQCLMQNQHADMVFTDPPYNVNYVGRTAKQQQLTNDHLTESDFNTLLDQAFGCLSNVIKPTASLYVCCPDAHRTAFEAALISHDFAIRNYLVWVKQHFAAGFGRYRFQHEPILYCHQKDQRDAWYGDRRQSTVWFFDKPHANRLHPTMKPVGLIEKALLNSSREGEIVLDIFGGSGSTLIACEKNARVGYLMELDPRYVDAIVQRWQQFTGQMARLSETQASFADMARIRLSQEDARQGARPVSDLATVVG